MICLTLIFFDIYIFCCFKFVLFLYFLFSFVFLAPKITTSDAMSYVNIISRLYMFCFFDFTFFCFIFLAPEITSTDGMYVDII